VSKRLAVVQSNYVPWKGYFDLIGLADEFVLYDDVAYTKNDWRNRNRIKTQQGPLWLTIPVDRSSIGGPIDAARVSDGRWRERHWRSIEQSYRHAVHFDRYANGLKALYEQDGPLLARVDRAFIAAICGWLGIETPLTDVREYAPEGEPTERLVDLCGRAGATEYLTGPSAQAYLREELFASAGISLVYMDYADYPEYPQLHGPFVHEVSVLDLLLNTGPDAAAYMKWSR
jgi:hypothetical protein